MLDINNINKNDILIIDGNNLIARHYYALKEKLIQKHIDNNIPLRIHLKSFFYKILRFIDYFDFKNVYIAIDDKSVPNFRKQLYDKYKQKREEKPLLEESLNIVKKILNILNINTICYPGYESDDVIASIVNDQNEKANHIYIWSLDKDLYQLLDKKTSIISFDKNKHVFNVYTQKDLLNEYNFNKHQFLIYKILFGDSSDCIPKIPYLFFNNKIKKLISSTKDIYELINNDLKLTCETQKKFFKILKNNVELVNRNIKLATLKNNLKYSSHMNQQINIEKFDYSRAINQCFALCKNEKTEFLFKNFCLYLKNWSKKYKKI